MIVVRFFNTVGPRQTGQYGMVVPTFVRQALQRRADHRVRRRQPAAQLHLRRRRRRGPAEADGHARRRLARSSTSATPRKSRFASSPSESRQATGSSSEIVTIPYDQAYEEGFEDMPRRVPDLTKIHKAIGYVPQVQLDEIIERVVAEKRSYAGSNRSIR